jgi:hypothetical protein
LNSRHDDAWRERLQASRHTSGKENGLEVVVNLSRQLESFALEWLRHSFCESQHCSSEPKPPLHVLNRHSVATLSKKTARLLWHLPGHLERATNRPCRPEHVENVAHRVNVELAEHANGGGFWENVGWPRCF